MTHTFTRGVYVAIGCSTDHSYDFLLPLTSRLWRDHVGIEPILLLAEEPKKWHAANRTGVVMREIMDSEFKHYHVGDIPRPGPAAGPRKPAGRGGHAVAPVFYDANVVAQSSRQHVATLSWIGADDFIMLSDVDLWPIAVPFYHQADRTKRMTLWYANAYQYVNHCSCHLGATAATWRELMGLRANDRLEQQLRETLDLELWPKMKDLNPREAAWQAWNFDEWNTSTRLRSMSWYPAQCQMIERVGAPPADRIDRSLPWDQSLTIGGKTDAHVLRPAQSDENWPRMRALFAQLLPSDLDWADDYRARYIQAAQ